MEKIELKLCSRYHGDLEIDLMPKPDMDYFDIPNGKELVYNDDGYSFHIKGSSNYPDNFYINDEKYEIEIIKNDVNGWQFKLKENDIPFLHSFGAVKIEIDISGLTFVSNSISVMVSNTSINNNVMNMVQYIYDNCEHYLYEEHKHSKAITGIKNNEIVSLEAKIALLNKILRIYKEAYPFLKLNPYSKLAPKESIDSFDKLQVISSNTMRYISTHCDELVSADFDTGIRYNKQYYQPNRILIEKNECSYDVYENQITVGFLKTIVREILKIRESLKSQTYFRNNSTIKSGYIDSVYYIFSRSIKRIEQYIQELERLQEDYTQIYFHISKMLKIDGMEINHIPIFTPVFRSINVYRHIYRAINEWFLCGNYDLKKDDLLLSFVSTSKIYEYYCLIKILKFFESQTGFKYIESCRLTYNVNNNYYADTRYNNYFKFINNDQIIELYFQPVIYGNDKAINGIGLYRNTSSNSRAGITYKGNIYTPDYLLKISSNSIARYIVADAKFSTTQKIRKDQLQELVYKYLFSISTLNDKDILCGLYVICGKTSSNDKEDIVHDIAHKFGRSASPFAEILVMSGTNTENDYIPSKIFDTLKSIITQ